MLPGWLHIDPDMIPQWPLYHRSSIPPSSTTITTSCDIADRINYAHLIDAARLSSVLLLIHTILFQGQLYSSFVLPYNTYYINSRSNIFFICFALQYIRYYFKVNYILHLFCLTIHTILFQGQIYSSFVLPYNTYLIQGHSYSTCFAVQTTYLLNFALHCNVIWDTLSISITMSVSHILISLSIATDDKT